MRFLLLLGCVCACASTFIPPPLLKKYAAIKIAESCVGRDVVQQVYLEMSAAYEKCNSEMMDNTITVDMDVPSIYSNVHRGYRPVIPVRPGYIWPVAPHAYYGYNQQHHQQKRSLLPSSDKLQKLKMKVQSAVSNVTCVCRELGVLTEDNEPDYPSIKKKMMSLPISQELIDDFCTAVDHCRDFSSCIPEAAFNKIPIVKDFGRTVAFFKCFKMEKTQACMKQDFRSKLMSMGIDKQTVINALGGEVDPDDIPGTVLGLLFGSSISTDEMF